MRLGNYAPLKYAHIELSPGFWNWAGRPPLPQGFFGGGYLRILGGTYFGGDTNKAGFMVCHYGTSGQTQFVDLTTFPGVVL